MNKNEIIISNINSKLVETWNYLESTSFEEIIRKDLSESNDTTYSTKNVISESIFKDETVNDLNNILNNKELINYFNQLHKSINLINAENLKTTLSSNFLKSIQNNFQVEIYKQNKSPIGIILIEYDFEYKASIAGFEKNSYKFPILDRPEYIKYDYQNEIFSSGMSLDLKAAFKPILDIEKKISAENLELIEEVTSYGFEYEEKLNNLFVLNCCKILNIAILNVKEKIFNSGLNFESEIFIYLNEHDCEKRNICILSKDN